jgi:hypothetical protein
MANIPEHDSKKEWERGHIECCRVDLSISRSAVGLHYLVEGPCEVVESEVSRGCEMVVLNFIHLGIETCTDLCEHSKQFLFVILWHPK